jgi:peptidoglycan-associated lipoprotein
MPKFKYSKGLVLVFLSAALVVAQGCTSGATRVSESTNVQDGNLDGSARLTSGPGRITSIRGTEENLSGAGSRKNGTSRLGISDIERMLVFFNYDQFKIRADMRLNLDQVAQYLLENQRIRVQIEGHSDERGTPEYNIALSHKRSQSVKSYLLNLGVSASRMQTVSYGEERPLDTRSNKEAWQQNRRAKFNIVSGFSGTRN